MKKNLDIRLKKNLVITNIFCQSLGPSLYRGSTVLNFIYFSKSGGGGEAPQVHPLRGPCNACLSSKGGNTEQKLENSVYIIR